MATEQTLETEEDETKMTISEPTFTYDEQRRKSGNALHEISATIADQRRSNVVDSLTTAQLKENVADDNARKNADMVVKNVKRISVIELQAQQQVEQLDALKDKDEKDRKKVTVIEIETLDEGTIKEESFKERQRGSIQRGPGISFPTLTAAQDAKPSDRHMPHTPVFGELDMSATAASGMHLLGRPRLGTNVGVHSFIFELPPPAKLAPLEAAGFASVLQECLDYLGLLQFVIPAEIDDRWDDSFKTINEKYGVPDEPRIMFREDMGLLPLIPSVAEKIQRDRTFLYNILKDTVEEIKCHRSFNVFERAIDDVVKTHEGEQDLEVNYQIWTAQVQQLMELIESDRQRNEEETRERLEMAQKMNAEVDNTIFLHGSKLGYVERWEGARLDHENLILVSKEAELTDAMAECAKLAKADKIVSGEVRTYLEANTKEMEDEILSWTSQYNEEIERRTQEMNEFKEQMEEQKAALQDLYALKEERQVFIDEVLDEKERLKQEEEYWSMVQRAATIIQALWRGVLVRKQLGPFKGYWTYLRKRNKRAALARKKKAQWEKKMARKWEATKLKKLKNVIDPNK